MGFGHNNGALSVSIRFFVPLANASEQSSTKIISARTGNDMSEPGLINQDASFADAPLANPKLLFLVLAHSSFCALQSVDRLSDTTLRFVRVVDSLWQS